MLCSALAAVVIMINLVLTHDTTAEGVIPKEERKYGLYSPEKEDYSLEGDHRKAIKHFKIRDLESIKIKLKNVVEKYELKKKNLSALYGGVAGCGLDYCKKFHGFPKVQKLKNFHCKKTMTPHGLKKQIRKLLSYFHSGVESYVEIFQEVINFEKWPRFKEEGISNDGRLQVLNELQTDIKTMIVEIVEIETLRKNKRLKFFHEPRSRRKPIPAPKFRTDLMIKEWRIIQQSREFLKNWLKKLQIVFKCWEKRKPKWDLQKNVIKLHSENY